MFERRGSTWTICVYVVTVDSASCREQKWSRGAAERAAGQWKRRCSSWRGFATCVCATCATCSSVTGCETMCLKHSWDQLPVILINMSATFISQAFFILWKYHLIMNFGIIVLFHDFGKLPAWLPAHTQNVPHDHCWIFAAETERKLQHVLIISPLLLWLW